MTRRFLTIILAIVLALIGTGAVLIYVKQAENGYVKGKSAVTVLVAAQQVPAGTTASTALADGLLTKQQVPAASAPAEHISSISPALGSLVFSADVPQGELILRPMLVTAVQATSGLAIPQGMVAVTIPLCVPQEVAGYVYPGAQVAVFDTVVTGTGSNSVNTNSACGTKAVSSTAKITIRTRVMLPKVTVLAIGQAAAPGTTGSVTSAAFGRSASSASQTSATSTVLVTFAVDQADAERVITLAQSGLPYLALLTKSSTIGPDSANLQFFPPYK